MGELKEGKFKWHPREDKVAEEENQGRTLERGKRFAAIREKVGLKTPSEIEQAVMEYLIKNKLKNDLLDGYVKHFLSIQAGFEGLSNKGLEMIEPILPYLKPEKNPTSLSNLGDFLKNRKGK